MRFRQRSYRVLSDTALLQRLFSDDAGAASYAWKEFLRRYTKLFLKVIWQFEHDADAVMEKYTYICTRLAANDCARLRRYQPEGRATPAKLSTWLIIVIKNLCVEQRRATQGRRRLPRALTSMSVFDQKVFRLHYWKGYTAPEIEEMLTAEALHTGFSVAEALDRIEALALRPSKTWINKAPVFTPFDEQHHTPERADGLAGEERGWSEAMLEALRPEERLVVRLRFWEDLTAQEIAEVLQGPTPRQVYGILEHALKTMRHLTRQES